MVPKVFILLWKDLLMRRNHPFITALEILVPVTLIILENALMPKVPREAIDSDPMSFTPFQDKFCIAKHGHYGSIIYEPSTPFTDALMSKASCYAGYKKSNVKAGKLSDNSSYFHIGVKFELNSNNDIPDVLNYTLYPTNTLWVNLNTLWRQSGRAVPKYSVFTMKNVVELQRAIDTSYLFMKNVTAKEINLQNTDMFGRSIFIMSQLVYFAVFVQLLFMMPPVISRIVEEKFTGAKELMLMMGVSKRDIWLAKFLDTYLIQLISVTGVVIFFYVPLKEESNVLEKDPLQLWAIIMFGFIGFIIFVFFLTCFFQKSTMAVFIIGCFCVIVFLVDDFLFAHPDIPGYALYITCIFPHTALINAVFIWLQSQSIQKSVRLDENLLLKEDAPVLYEIFLIMILDIIVYGTLTWYFENINPGKFGVPKPFNFFLKKSYWVQTKVEDFRKNSRQSETPDGFEAVPPNLDAAISIQNVSKIFKSIIGGNVVAVDRVNVNFYRGEISALLGHNGAGKTTVFSMITGLTYPTSGKLSINGYDINVDINKARRSLGLCPQKDMLFNDLNAIQILQFYGAIKGLTLSQAKNEAMEIIKKLKLENSEKTHSAKLSGGQKRKVSLAIALIGGSQILILDEPTSGMDPEIRREIWELLLKYRGQRTILLTTHFMEEADALCDRIAIMDHGKVKCYGSSMFLKSKFGKGYVLNIVLPDVDRSDKLIEFVKSYLPSAKLKAQNIRTLSFELAESKVDVFPSLLSGLEDKQSANEIISYSVNVASLEEVFLSLKSGQGDFDSVDSPHYTNLDFSEEPNLAKSSGFSLLYQQFLALIMKKWIVYKKSYLSLISFSVLPAVIILIVALLASENGISSEEVDLSYSRPLSYSLNLYKPSEILLSGDDEPGLKEAFKKYAEGYGNVVRETQNITESVYEVFKEDFFKYSKLINLGVEFHQDEINIFHNHEAVHMVPVSLNLIHNFLLNYAKKNGSIITSVDAKFANKDTYAASPRITTKCSVLNIVDYSGAQAFFYLIGPVKEYFCGAKELQLMVTPTTMYWLTHLLWDITSFFIYVVILYLAMGYAQSDDSMFQDSVEVLTGFLLWGIALLLICYIISSFLKNLSAAFSVNALVYVIFTFVIYFFIVLDVIPLDYKYLHPNCIFKFGLTDLCKKNKSDFLWILLVYDAVLFSFLILKDSKILSFVFHRSISKLINLNYSLPNEIKEELVQKDEIAVKGVINNKKQSDSVLIADQLKRWYFKSWKPQPAVRGVSFAVNRGECFGLLGVNGAGKTSTFKMLTGEIPPSHGKIYVCSEEVSVLRRQKYLYAIGYCPQFGGLIPMFDGREMLRFFARLRGVHTMYVNEQVEKWLAKLGLLEFAKKRCGTYSGGNQRKLSTGVSLIGDNPLIFLDEPTTGVDPLSRRSIWNLIAEIQRNGQSIILTSHSMDECEALCSRVAIMVKGKFRCIGETTTLKDKFGQGYSVRLKVVSEATPEELDSLKKFFASKFPGCELIDEHLTILQYKITNKNVTSADVFKELVHLKRSFPILESYSASAATLEQIFINFAREKQNL